MFNDSVGSPLPRQQPDVLLNKVTLSADDNEHAPDLCLPTLQFSSRFRSDVQGGCFCVTRT